MLGDPSLVLGDVNMLTEEHNLDFVLTAVNGEWKGFASILGVEFWEVLLVSRMAL